MKGSMRCSYFAEIIALITFSDFRGHQKMQHFRKKTIVSAVFALLNQSTKVAKF